MRSRAEHRVLRYGGMIANLQPIHTITIHIVSDRGFRSDRQIPRCPDASRRMDPRIPTNPRPKSTQQHSSPAIAHSRRRPEAQKVNHRPQNSPGLVSPTVRTGTLGLSDPHLQSICWPGIRWIVRSRRSHTGHSLSLFAASQISKADESFESKQVVSRSLSFRAGARITVVARTWSTFSTCSARWNRAPLISAPVLSCHEDYRETARQSDTHSAVFHEDVPAKTPPSVPGRLPRGHRPLRGLGEL